MASATDCPDNDLEVMYEGVCRNCHAMYQINLMMCAVYAPVADTYPPLMFNNDTGLNDVCVHYDCIEDDDLLHCNHPVNRHDGSDTLEVDGNYLNFAVTGFDPVTVVPHINWLSDLLYYNQEHYDYDGGDELVSAWVSVVRSMDYPYEDLNSHSHCLWRMGRDGEFGENYLDDHCSVKTMDGDDEVYNFFAALTICYTNQTEFDCENKSLTVGGEPMTWQRLAYREPYKWNRVWYGETDGYLSQCHRNWMDFTILVQNDAALTTVDDNVILGATNIANGVEHLVLHSADGNHTVQPMYEITLSMANFDLSVERYVGSEWQLQETSSTHHYLAHTDFYRMLIDTQYRFNYTMKQHQYHGMPDLREAVRDQFDNVTFVYKWTYDENYDGAFSSGPRYTWQTYSQEVTNLVDFTIVTSISPFLEYWMEDSVRMEVSIQWSHSSDGGGRRLSVHDSYNPLWGTKDPLAVYGYTGQSEGDNSDVDTKVDGHDSIGMAELSLFAIVFFVLSVVAMCTVRWHGSRKGHSAASSSSKQMSVSELHRPLLYNKIAQGVVVKGEDVL